MNGQGQHSWPRIFGVFAAGVAMAFLVGKVPAALPALRVDMDLSLVEAGFLVSLLSAVAGVGGVLIGALAETLGQRRTALMGLAVAAVGGVAGAMTSGPAALLASRVFEGIGFFMVSVSLPALIIRLSDERRRPAAMGLWGAYLPAGAGLVLLAGGMMIATIGWQGMWLGISGALAAMFVVLLWVAPAADGTQTGARRGAILTNIGDTLRTPGAVLLAVTFGCYSGQYMAVTSFVPLILVEKAGWALPAAAAAGAAVMLANVTGNIAAGLLLARGAGRGRLIVIAAMAMAVGAGVVMADQLPVAVRIAGAVLFSSFGGLIPGALFAGVGRHAPTPAHISTVNGLMLQAVAIGQLIGPPAASWLTMAGGGVWFWSLAYLLPMAVLTMLAGLAIGRVEDVGDTGL